MGTRAAVPSPLLDSAFLGRGFTRRSGPTYRRKGPDSHQEVCFTVWRRPRYFPGVAWALGAMVYLSFGALDAAFDSVVGPAAKTRDVTMFQWIEFLVTKSDRQRVFGPHKVWTTDEADGLGDLLESTVPFVEGTLLPFLDHYTVLAAFIAGVMTDDPRLNVDIEVGARVASYLVMHGELGRAAALMERWSADEAASAGLGPLTLAMRHADPGRRPDR